MKKEKIVKKISNFISRHGGSEKCYVGISKKPKKRLKDGHNVDLTKNNYDYWTASSKKVAREIEYHFTHKVNTEGDTGGGQEDSKKVYVYKMTKNTEP